MLTKDDWLHLELHMHRLDKIIECLEEFFDKSKDHDERLELMDKILKL